MKRLLALTGLGLALSGCIIIFDPTPPANSISNLRTQEFYCSGVNGSFTRFKFKFDVNKAIAGYEVWVSDPGGELPASPQAAGNAQGPTVFSGSVPTGRFSTAVEIRAGANDAPILGPITGVVPTTIGVSAGRLWVRAIFSDGQKGEYVTAAGSVAPRGAIMTPINDVGTCVVPITSVP